MLDDYADLLTAWLEYGAKLPRKQRRTAQRLFEFLQVGGMRGARVRPNALLKFGKGKPVNYNRRKAFSSRCFFPAGETCQFDWSHEYVILGGVLHTVKVAHFRLAYSRKMFLAAYPRETQGMVLDAHSRAFTVFGGVPKRMILATAPALPYLLHPCSRMAI